MRRLFSVLVLACVLGFAIAGCSQPLVSPGPSSTPGTASQGATAAPSTSATSPAVVPPPTDQTQGGLTLAKFNQVKEGMTYEQVSQIMGGPGDKIGESVKGKTRVAVYGWYSSNPLGSAVVSFRNDAVDHMQQAGLK